MAFATRLAPCRKAAPRCSSWTRRKRASNQSLWSLSQNADYNLMQLIAQFPIVQEVAGISVPQKVTIDPPIEYVPGEDGIVVVIDGMIDDVGRMVRGKPVMVLYVPSRAALLGQDDSRYKSETRRFAEKIGAAFHDSAELYKGMSAQMVRGHFLPDDGHWNQRGSDRFAAYVSALLR